MELFEIQGDVECREKLLLEKLVIKRGSVLEGDADKDKGGGMTAYDLLSLLNTPVDTKSDLAQSGAVDDEVQINFPSASCAIVLFTKAVLPALPTCFVKSLPSFHGSQMHRKTRCQPIVGPPRRC